MNNRAQVLTQLNILTAAIELSTTWVFELDNAVICWVLSEASVEESGDDSALALGVATLVSFHYAYSL